MRYFTKNVNRKFIFYKFERLHGQYDDNNADEEDFFTKVSLLYQQNF